MLFCESYFNYHLFLFYITYFENLNNSFQKYQIFQIDWTILTCLEWQLGLTHFPHLSNMCVYDLESESENRWRIKNQIDLTLYPYMIIPE